MKRLLRFASVAVVALVAGCASAPPQPTRESVHGKIVCDHDYVNAVHHHAKRIGTKVVWVACPDFTLRYVPTVNPGEVG